MSQFLEISERIIVIAALGLFLGIVAHSQTPEQNLQTCLSGRYPALCNHAALTPAQLQETRAAELRENLKTCMEGRYPALCDHSKLTPEQSKAVAESERIENLRLCSSGSYPALCNHALLSADELAQVQSAEHAENLKVCLDGHYASVCNHSLLTPDETKNVSAAENRALLSQPKRTPKLQSARRQGSCESGLSITSVEGDGKIIKLDDGSAWEVDDVDTVDTALWLTADNVVVCEGKMINTDENESAGVTPLSSAHGGISSSTTVSQTSSDGEIALYDGAGSAVAYIATSEDLTIYTWAGRPVAYLDGENVYGFNGKHLGWFLDGRIYDHKGKVAGTTAETAVVPLKSEPFKGFKQFKPFKAFEQFAPIQPILALSWSQLPLAILLSQGSK